LRHQHRVEHPAVLAELEAHLGEETEVSAQGCEECLQMGDAWVHLRECSTCGRVGCCDKSKNKHARKHFHASEHALIQPFEPVENWRWCYIDTTLV
jgi:hypothetical protein